MRKLLFAGLLATLATARAAAPEMSLFGLSLGTPEDEVPTCQKNEDTSKSWMVYEDKLCKVEATRGAKAWGDVEYDINLPSNKPDYLRNLSIAVRDGKVAAIRAATYGEKYQDQVLAALTSKFGKPKQAANDQLQNAFGAKLIGRNALWMWKDAAVTFFGVESSRDWGSVKLESKTHWQAMQQYEKTRDHAELKP